MKIKYVEVVKRGNKYQNATLLENTKLVCPECDNQDSDLLSVLSVVACPFTGMLMTCHACKCVFTIQILEG